MDEHLDIYTRVCTGLRKRPLESVEDAAKRAFRERKPNAARRAAAIIILNGGPPEKAWDRMKRAADALEPGPDCPQK